jgi:hypothetical protein
LRSSRYFCRSRSLSIAGPCEAGACSVMVIRSAFQEIAEVPVITTAQDG